MRRVPHHFLAAALTFAGLAGCPGADDPDAGDAHDAHPHDGGSSDAQVMPGQQLYVRAGDGVDEPGAGSADQPFASIQYAVDQATPPTQVHVAAATYVESVVLRPGVSLRGGYSAQDWGDRDVQRRADVRYRTSIEAAINIGVTVGMGVTTDDVIEGFEIHGGIDSHSHQSYGIYLYDGGSPTIRFNTVEGGRGDTYGNGIGLFGSDALIVANTIAGGDAQLTYGIRSGNGSAPTIAGNTISGGVASDISYGILLNGASPTIVGNTIDGGSPPNDAYAIFHFADAHPVIDGNILFTRGGDRRYGLYEFAPGCRPASLRANDWFGCPTALYRAYGAPGELTSAAAIDALEETDAGDNLELDPLFVSPEDWHLQAASPPEIREGGWTSSLEAAAIDHDGAPRSHPWSIGAFELDLG